MKNTDRSVTDRSLPGGRSPMRRTADSRVSRTLLIAGATLSLGAGAATAGVMLGAHVGYESSKTSQADFVALESKIGRKLAIDSDYEDWEAFPDISRVDWDVRNGRQSLLSWRVVFQGGKPIRCATAVAITAGTYDTQLARQAAAIKALRVPVLVRFNYEMTDNAENTCFTGFPVRQNLPLAGARYIAAWKHIVDAFRNAGASNAKWVFAPSADAYEKGHWTLFYPGATYVDWMAADQYNKTDVPASFATDTGVIAFYDAAAPLGKPLMISETGANNDPKLNPDAQTLWLTTLRTFYKTHPSLAAFVYWDNPGGFLQTHPNYGGSGYVLQGAGLAAFQAIASDPYFK